MRVMDASGMTDEVLVAYDRMMIECIPKIEKVASLALTIWSDVLEELGRRRKIRLVSGSYDDVGKAIIQRL